MIARPSISSGTSDGHFDGSLQQAGHIVCTAKDGQEWIAAASQFRPDVAILDIGFPGISGYDVARHLRGQGATASALLIAVTGYGQAEDRHSAKVSGFDHHLLKPVPFGELLALIAPAAASNPAGR